MESGILSRHAVLLALAAAVTACTPTNQPEIVPESERIALWEHLEPTATAELLPYGRSFIFEGEAFVLQRIEGPPLELSDGRLLFAEPLDLGEALPSVTGRLAPGTHPTEIGVFDLDGGRRAATFAVGDVAGVRQWEIVRSAQGITRFATDSGLGVVLATPALPAIKRTVNLDTYLDVLAPMMDNSVNVYAVEVDGAVPAVAFDCGVGDGDYPVYAGKDASGATVAYAADLELMHKADQPAG